MGGVRQQGTAPGRPTPSRRNPPGMVQGKFPTLRARGGTPTSNIALHAVSSAFPMYVIPCFVD